MGQTGSRQEQFWESCSFGREWLVKQMIEEGIDVDWVSHIHDCCPIHVASQGKPNVVRMLLQANCQVDSKDCKENTALHHAAMSGEAEITSMLLDAGANIDATNTNGWSPLFNACYWNKPQVVDILLERGADFTLRNKEGRTVVHELCRSKTGQEDQLLLSLEILIACEVDINQKSVNLNQWDSEADFTPLLFACYHGYCQLAERILQAGGDLTITDMNGWNALHWAAQRGHKEITLMLIKHGADIHAVGLRGETAADSTNNELIRDILTPSWRNSIVSVADTGASDMTPDRSHSPTISYPVIVSNGYVTTDEEDSLEDDDSSGLPPHVCSGLAAQLANQDSSLASSVDASSLDSSSAGVRSHKPPVTLGTNSSLTSNDDVALPDDELEAETPVA